MQPDTIVTLGEFEFFDTEVPEHIPFGGRQHLVVHRLVGGQRVVDAMGRDDMALSWSGLLFGEQALPRARYLDGLRIAGKPLTLTWSELAYSVVIEEFQADFERFYKMPYRITCQVVRDLNAPLTATAVSGIDNAIRGDNTLVQAMGVDIGDDALSASLGTLNTAISAVSDFAKAAQSTIQSVLLPLADAQARVKVLITSTGNTIANVTTLGGILPNNPVSQQAAKMFSQVTAMQSLPKLYNMQSVLGRMNANIGTIGSGNRIVATGGGNLFSMAQKYYNDATAWTTLANANGLKDPQLAGLKKIAVPSTTDESGGVLKS